MHFEHEGYRVNILDTPGHQDFSEDTYRTLMAADSAVMLIDAGKGVETQTRKLFEVCRLRRIPIFTFVNKMDRQGREPLDLLDEIEEVLGIDAVPVNWPIGAGREFRGVYDRIGGRLLVFSGGSHGTHAHRAARDRRGAGFRPGAGRGRHLRGRAGAVAGAARRRGRQARPRGGRRGRPDAGLLRQRAHQLRRAAVPRALPRDGAAAARARVGRRAGRPGGAALLGLRVQDPGQHGSGPPRPRRLRARLLRPLREGQPDAARAHRQARAPGALDAADGAGARGGRRGVPGRRGRALRSGRLPDRRHACRTRAASAIRGSPPSRPSTSRASRWRRC